MLKHATLFPTIPVTNLDRAKIFYRDTLGLGIMMEDPAGVMLEAGNGTGVYLYQRGASKADHTLAGFKVDDLASEMAALKEKGITFEEYDLPGLKTVNGIASMGNSKAAWFKDPDGNILSLTQLS